MLYFENIKKGDKVWSCDFGWGVVTDIFYTLVPYFEVKFKKIDKVYYTFKGIRLIENEKQQTLFWNKPMNKKIKIEIKYDTNNLEILIK